MHIDCAGDTFTPEGIKNCGLLAVLEQLCFQTSISHPAASSRCAAACVKQEARKPLAREGSALSWHRQQDERAAARCTEMENKVEYEVRRSAGQDHDTTKEPH